MSRKREDVHPFLAALLDRDAKWLQKFGDAAKKAAISGKRPEFHVTRDEHYVGEVFRYATRLADCPNAIRVAAAFVRAKPPGTILKRTKIRRHEYIAYHYNNYVVRLHTTWDIALRLVGTTLSLGVGERLMTEQAVLDNIWTTRWSLRRPLKALKAATCRVQRERNAWIHEGAQPEIVATRDLSAIEVAQDLSQGTYRWLEEEDMAMSYREASADIAEGIESDAEAVEAAIDTLLTSLLPAFHYWRETYRERLKGTMVMNPTQATLRQRKD